MNDEIVKPYDVFHLHSYRFLAKSLKQRNPTSKVILEYHGTDARGTPAGERFDDEQHCDLILISTPDLIEWVPNGLWLPLPIDTDHFKLSEHRKVGLFMKSSAYYEPKIGSIPLEILPA